MLIASHKNHRLSINTRRSDGLYSVCNNVMFIWQKAFQQRVFSERQRAKSSLAKVRVKAKCPLLLCILLIFFR